jgi:hypothetical protein
LQVIVKKHLFSLFPLQPYGVLFGSLLLPVNTIGLQKANAVDAAYTFCKLIDKHA